MVNMKYAVDRIEDKIIVLENLSDKSIIELPKENINFLVKEKDILVYDKGTYRLDNKTKKDRIKIIQEKFNKVKKNL